MPLLLTLNKRLLYMKPKFLWLFGRSNVTLFFKKHFRRYFQLVWPDKCKQKYWKQASSAKYSILFFVTSVTSNKFGIWELYFYSPDPLQQILKQLTKSHYWHFGRTVSCKMRSSKSGRFVSNLLKPDSVKYRTIARFFFGLYIPIYRHNSKIALAVNCFYKTLHLRCLTGFWIRLCAYSSPHFIYTNMLTEFIVKFRIAVDHAVSNDKKEI